MSWRDVLKKQAQTETGLLSVVGVDLLDGEPEVYPQITFETVIRIEGNENYELEETQRSPETHEYEPYQSQPLYMGPQIFANKVELFEGEGILKDKFAKQEIIRIGPARAVRARTHGLLDGTEFKLEDVPSRPMIPDARYNRAPQLWNPQ